MGGGLWAMVTIGGPILLAIVLAFVMLSNRRRRTQEKTRHTEEATRNLYRRLDEEDKARDSAEKQSPPRNGAEKQS